LADRLLETLQSIESHWRRLGAPIVEGLRPGLTLDEIDGLAAEYGWQLPWELRVWWSWHDGADADCQREIGPGGFWFLSLDEALRYTDHERVLQPDTPQQRPAVWDNNWLLFMRHDAQRLFADCTPSPLRNPGSAPVGLLDDWENADVAVARSLLQAADLWRWMLEQDMYEVRPPAGLLPVDSASWPLWLGLSRIA
jgi:hypothetical protein